MPQEASAGSALGTAGLRHQLAHDRHTADDCRWLVKRRHANPPLFPVSHDRAKRSEWSRVLAGFAPAAPERLGSPRRSPGPQEDTAPRYNRRSMEAADTSIHGGLEARTR